MTRWLGRFEPQFYAIVRIVAGVMFALHGTAKLFGWPGTKPPAADDLLIAAGVIETATGVMVAIGYQASWAAFVASGTMAVAYFKSHAFGVSFFPTINRGELAVLYCFLFLYIAARGAGTWSIDGNAEKRAG
ncbi:MAG TPA: DoxX family protein [Thermoanaerobaculia bacterium]|nr:DoxX family protein [Thermoanaerobaculia bacterium]